MSADTYVRLFESVTSRRQERIEIARGRVIGLTEAAGSVTYIHAACTDGKVHSVPAYDSRVDVITDPATIREIQQQLGEMP